MKGKLQKFFLAKPEMTKKPEAPYEDDEPNETEIFRIRIESKEQKEIGVTKVGFSEPFVNFIFLISILFSIIFFIIAAFRLFIFQEFFRKMYIFITIDFTISDICIFTAALKTTS